MRFDLHVVKNVWKSFSIHFSMIPGFPSILNVLLVLNYRLPFWPIAMETPLFY